MQYISDFQIHFFIILKENGYFSVHPLRKKHKYQANLKSKGLFVEAGIVLSLLWKWVWDKKRGCIAHPAMQPLLCYE